jgi:hypothetical protein
MRTFARTSGNPGPHSRDGDDGDSQGVLPRVDSNEESRLPRAYRVMLNWFLWLGALDHVIGLPISNWGGSSND